jgi:ABC-type nitrate/sulfonate/bicarbonate transport system permease component
MSVTSIGPTRGSGASTRPPRSPGRSRRGRGRGLRRAVPRAIAAGIALAAWQGATWWLGIAVVPGPIDVAQSLVALSATPEFWGAVRDTVVVALAGLGLAAVVAIPLGIVVGSSRFLLTSSRLLVDLLRTVPPITLLPLVLLLWGPTATMQIALVVAAVFWPLFLQATYAVRETDPVQRDMARAYLIPTGDRWRRLLLPSSAPFLVTGFRVAATIALLVAVAAELIGNAPGVGREILLAQVAARPSDAYAYITVAALLGVALNLVIGVIQLRLLFWHQSVRDRASR